jgi:hypothetical protein
MRAAMGQSSLRYHRPAGWLVVVLIIAQQIVSAQGVTNVLLAVNDAPRLARDIGQYYVAWRGVPPRSICHIRTAETGQIDRAQSDREIAGAPVKDPLCSLDPHGR